MMLSLEGK